MNSSTSPLKLFLIFLRLGLTSFGGPVAHFGYFRQEFVVRRRWLDDAGFADLLALCQFLPGPSSSQLGLSVGILRGGLIGGVMAWLGFTLPAAVIMAGFGLTIGRWHGVAADWLHGLKLVAVAVVADAVWSLGKSLAADRPRFTLLILSAASVLIFPGVWGQVAVMLVAAVAGQALPTGPAPGSDSFPAIELPAWLSPVCLALFLMGLFLLPVAAGWLPALTLFERFYRAGALVFGGGHVVLPLLRDIMVPTGLIDDDQFLAGYGLAQAVPGPLFSFAAFLGAAGQGQPQGWLGAILGLVALFLPSFLLLLGILPHWRKLRQSVSARAALRGVNAAVVGLLLAAFYRPIMTSALLSATDFAVAATMFLLLATWRLPAWLLVATALLFSVV